MRRTLIATITVGILAAVPLAASAQGGDTPTCFGREATIVGEPGDDTIRATARGDVIATLGGNDRVWGNKGIDRICGGRGADFLCEGANRPRTSCGGNTQRGRVSGNRGNDTLVAALALGGPGADTVEPDLAFPLDMRVYGGPGWDIVRGRSGDDWLAGNRHNDELSGGDGRDFLHGGRGDDVCNPEPGPKGDRAVACESRLSI